MRVKKVRGVKRKLNYMIKQIEESTSEFPTHFYNGYWHLHLPVAQDFIDSSKTPKKVKRFCIQTLLNRAEQLIPLKPKDKEQYRVVVAINSPGLWASQIIVFKGDAHFKNFFNRNDEFQKWLPLADTRNIHLEWGLSVPEDLLILGFKEIITEEDDYHYEGEIWFIGELT
jgi:hypothetical protein